MRRSLSVSTAMLLAVALAGSTAAQEAEPTTPAAEPTTPAAEPTTPAAEPTTPAAESESAPVTETTTETVPVADYAGEWALHTEASRDRVRLAVENANQAKKKKIGVYRTLVGIHNDELEWLANHQPEDCYSEQYEQWRTAVEDLQAISEEAVELVRKGSRKALKRVAKRRTAAIKQLEQAVASVADCVDSTPPAAETVSLADGWIAQPVYVGDDGFVDRGARKLTIGDSGEVVLRVERNPYCRDTGNGLVTFVVGGAGEMTVEGRPGFAWEPTSLECRKKKGKGLVNVGEPAPQLNVMAYDAANDVLLMNSGAECYWRVDGGSKDDCTAFWRGTPPVTETAVEPEEMVAPAEEEAPAAPEEEAPAEPEESEG